MLSTEQSQEGSRCQAEPGEQGLGKTDQHVQRRALSWVCGVRVGTGGVRDRAGGPCGQFTRALQSANIIGILVLRAAGAMDGL